MRLFIYDEDVRLEGQRGVADDTGAERDRLLDIHPQLQGGVLAVLQLDDAGNTHEIYTLAEFEIPDYGRARQDQHADAWVVLHEGVGDRPAAAQMAEAEGVVTVDQDSPISVGHDRSLSRGT